MKPQYYDFIELFKNNIKIEHICSDLKCWESDLESRETALQFMKDNNFTLLGIKKKGIVLSKVLNNKGIIEDINLNEIIRKNLPITELLDKFMNEHKTHYFININGNIEKIVTNGDLQKGPARLLLFGLIMNFEVVCIEFILRYAPNWQEILDQKFFKNIKERYESLKTQDLEIDMLHCSFLDDKIEIIKEVEKFKDFCSACKKDEGDIRFNLKKLKKLRNNLAHSNSMRADFNKWDELLESIRICRIFTGEMRKFL
ncbi:hypothetical protein LCGC14_0564500 [marine sediment metagenome]|uniref:RiboL-PSP-HEPN domain-containing protein n=1 Tax=marine sediment metagenome TaxID=412755 RepID=A0A0F9RR69_9ZZZZ|nr:hypothetical protein [archaeon]